jgi:branched-chain amino acid transport system substrate-binding protein
MSSRRTFRYLLTGATIAALALVSAGSGVARPTANTARVGPQITIGAALPLTGPFAGFGATWINGVKLAWIEINRSGGVNRRPLKVSIEDWASDTAKAVQVFQKFVDVNKAPVVLGGGSGAILAQAAVANRTRTVLLNAAAQTPAMRQAGNYVFSNINTADEEALDLVRFMKTKLKIDKAIIYYVDNATGQGQRDGLTAACKKLGVEIIDTVSHSFTDTNYRTVLARMRSKNPPAVLVGSHREHTGLTLKQASEIGFKTTWLGLSPTVGDDTIQIAGRDAIEGFYTVRSQFDVTQNSPRVKKFVQDYKKRFGSAPDIYAAHFYDAVYMVKRAAEQRGAKDGPSFQKAFASLNGHGEKNRFRGVAGPVVFDRDGMVVKSNFILQVTSGNLKLVRQK